MLDLSQCPELESDPEVLGGAWCFRGTRMPLFAVLENIESGVENVLELFPSLNKEQVEKVLIWLALNTRPTEWNS
jgi:uncharacterized protein (DUF433 family)